MNRIVLTVTFLLVAFFVQAGPLWMRYPKISPDGKQIAFSYKGDIYVVPAEGGEARQLTTHPAYDRIPCGLRMGNRSHSRVIGMVISIFS